MQQESRFILNVVTKTKAKTRLYIFCVIDFGYELDNHFEKFPLMHTQIDSNIVSY